MRQHLLDLTLKAFFFFLPSIDACCETGFYFIQYTGFYLKHISLEQFFFAFTYNKMFKTMKYMFFYQDFSRENTESFFFTVILYI